jgi:hypothetical protein
MTRTNRELKDNFKKENIAFRKAIKVKCDECLCGQKIDCMIDDCGLYNFRPYGRKSG